ncbi:MAG: NAD-dependent epimerase/dehydratase family protein [Victivallaceae bacterium]
MKNCLLTGYPGFLSSFLYEQLKNHYCIYTLGLLPTSDKLHIQADITGCQWTLPDIKFDLVIHAAGKAHTVPRNNAEKQAFFDVNEVGTANVIAALNHLTQPPASFVLISTVAVYGCHTGTGIDENHHLAATDSYGKSKINAEKIVQNWDAPKTLKGILRLPLIAGRNPPGNLGKMLAAIKKRTYFNIGSGCAKRSLVLIDDIADFIPLIAKQGGIYNLTDGCDVTFASLCHEIAKKINRRPNPAIPFLLAKGMALAGDMAGKILKRDMPFNSYVLDKMCQDLTFSSVKAQRELSWNPHPVIDNLNKVV